MNIIFDHQTQHVPQGHTLLELDSFRQSPSGRTRTAYCLIEKIPLDEFPLLEYLVKCHGDLMSAYREQNWEYCECAIQGLMGKFAGEMDSFYQDLAHRVQHFKLNPPGPDWDAVRDSAHLT